MKTNMNMMKSILMVLVVGALVCSSCKDGSPKETFDDETPPCNCLSTYGSTAHLAIDEACKCGGTECACTPKVYGNIANIPIYREASVSDAQAITAASNIEAGFAKITDEGSLIHLTSNKLSAIYISEEDAMDCIADDKEKFIIIVGFNFDSDDMQTVLEYYANG